jgi:dihydrofolate reductase
MKAIICQNASGYIGLDNRMLWHCKSELQHFARLTKDCTVLVGFNTALHLPILKNRVVKIDSRGAFFDDLDSIDWCIGGAKTYRKYQHLFKELHISTIIDNFDVGDTLMPTFDNLGQDCKIFNYTFSLK